MEDKHKTAQNENRFSALISLIKKESVEEIKDILQKSSHLLNIKDRSGRTALHYCSEHSSALCADYILELCPTLLKAQDNDGYTALHLSVISGNQVMTRYLIGKSDSHLVNECDNERHTAIHWATVCGQVECLHLLLNSGAHSSRADIHGAYPLHYSAQMCNPHSGICIGDDPRVGLAVLNRLLQCPDVDVDCVDSDGRTPLLWAASAGSADSLLALINAGANVAAKDKDGLTALHCASSRGHIDCVETLLTLCGADVNLMDANGCPPLFYAVTLGHADCTRLLVESGADVNAQDFKGRTAAHCGAARGQFETIKILGQLGANLWLRNSRGDLPLHEAVKSGRKELVKWLLDQIPAAVNATNTFGRSALHIAAINNNIELCKILIDIGADVNTVMKTKGHFITPLDAALQKGYRGVAKYLLLHGALPASRISHSLNKSSVQRVPSGRPMDSFTAFDNSSPIESYDEWRARSQSTDSALHSQTQFKPLDNSRTQLPKLPTLVKNGGDEQHINETSSSTPSSLMDNTNHYKNIREFETPLNDRPSNLKQAIITNVYVTNTPICHSKRVPPLKKIKKRRKTIVDGEDHKSLRVYTPSMSSSSSIINGEEDIKVVMETKDDSTFKLSDSLNERENTEEEETDSVIQTIDDKNIEKSDQKLTQSKSEDYVLNKDSNEVLAKEEEEEEVNERQTESFEKERDVPLEDKEENDQNIQTINKQTVNGFEEKDLKTKRSETKDSKSVKSSDSKGKDISDKSLKSSEVSARSQDSQKSTQEVNRTKRSVSRRRSSVVDVNREHSTKSIEKRVEVKHKSNVKKNDENVQKSDKKSETSRKSSTKTSARKEFDQKSKELSQHLDKQSKDVSKVKARKEFSDKLNKINKNSDKSDSKSEDKSDLSVSHKSDSKKLSEEDKDDKEIEDNRDIDSITYIKSDNESVKSNISSGNEKNDIKSEESLQNNAELKEGKSEETKPDEVPNHVIEDKGGDQDKGEYEEYYDQWESDSEKTVIDSQTGHKSGEDINNNSIDISDPQISLTSNEVINRSDNNLEQIVQKESEKKTIDEILDNLDHNSDEKNSENLSEKSVLENNHGKLDEVSEKTTEKTAEKSPPKATKTDSNTKTETSNGRTTERVSDMKQMSSRTQSKTSDKSKVSSGQSSKSLVNRSVEQKDNKIVEKRGLTSEQNKKPIAKRISISKEKSNMNNTNKKAERRPSIPSKSKLKSDDKIIKESNDSLGKKSYLSTSDMSLNKSSEEQNYRQSSPLKNSISNQDINENQDNNKYQDNNEDRNLTNISSEESIFDSSLVVADMERNDSRMYSDIDRLCPKEEVSPHQHIERNGVSPFEDQMESCNEFCNTGHKPESRCCHKLHFKTMPAHLGRVEVSHIGSRVDSRRDNRNAENVSYSRDRVRRVRRVRPTSDGYKAIDPNIITQTVEKSLRKYQLERKLFEELHELKRFQIRSGKSNEILMVKRLIDRFRREVKAPGMTDFSGNYTYKNYELYLYDQLRRLSTSNEGKVASLTRSLSQQNIHIISNSNENITQSSPELMQNSEGLDTNSSKTHENVITTDHQNQCSEENLIREKLSTNEIINKEEVIGVVSQTTHHSIECQIESSEENDQRRREDQPMGNHKLIDHFDNESVVTDSEPKDLEPSSCDLTTNATHYQNSELMSQNFRITEEVSHIVIDSKEQPNHRSESEINQFESNSTNISEKDEQNLAVSQSPDQRVGSVCIENQSLVEKIEEISEIRVNSILNEALNQQKKSSVDISNTETKAQNHLKQTPSLESNDSQTTNQISDAKSTYGSTKSAKIESRSSGLSRRMSSQSMRSTNTSKRRRSKERQSFRKECLKPVVDVKPSERAKNRKPFKRLRTSIPPKLKINISKEKIRNRWKNIKETEMKKVFLLSSHKQNELISGFSLWFELNKHFRENQSFDSQIDRYIIENRSSLQRTHSDSYLNKYHKIDTNSLIFDKSIK